MIKAVIFDLDNTLYDYDIANTYAESILFKCIMGDLGERDINIGDLLYEAKARVKNRLAGTAAEHNRILYMQEICEIIGFKSTLYAMKWYNTYWDSFLDKIKIYDYVIPCFEYLQNNDIKIGMLTDLTSQIQYRKIYKLGISQYIDALVTSEEVGVEKPDKRMFNRVINKIGCNPHEAIMVGDDLTKDIKGAKQLGMNTVLYKKDDNIIESIIHIIKE